MGSLSKNALVEKAIKSLWIGRMSVFEYISSTDTESKLTTQTLQETLTDYPCRLSHKRVASASGSNFPTQSQSTTLICDKTLQISAGSVIEVEQHDITKRFKQSGVSAVYSYHQEIPLELEDDYA